MGGLPVFDQRARHREIALSGILQALLSQNSGRLFYAVPEGRPNCPGQSQLMRWPVLDLLFVGIAIVFFVVSIGYVAACDRLMK